ncbi:hypothetical protein DFH09DRAFT_1274357 [Mycena vulgaris]|nr:hypothetical protein DFH09DRAFT_1274357 [Mycena vulgaris]
MASPRHTLRRLPSHSPIPPDPDVTARPSSSPTRPDPPLHPRDAFVCARVVINVVGSAPTPMTRLLSHHDDWMLPAPVSVPAERLRLCHQLKGDDIYYKDVNSPNSLNDEGKEESWIWTIGRAGDLTEYQEYVEDASSMKKVEILEQEFRIAPRGFYRIQEVWSSLAHDSTSNPGAVEKKASMYGKMGDQCKKAFTGLDGTWPADGENLADHIRAHGPVRTADWAVIAEATT